MKILTQLLDERRRIGKAVRAFVPKQEFFALFETLLHCAPCCDHLLVACLTQMWVLLADSDRNDEEKLDLGEILGNMCSGFVLSKDLAEKANGYMCVSTLFYVDHKPASLLMQSHGAILQSIFEICTSATAAALPSHLRPDGADEEDEGNFRTCL